MSLPPFPAEYRASGLLLHVTSLPSPYGIGDVGPAAVAWVDRLYDAGQRWWQALPLGPTGYGDSPYQPLSSFAGNALLISPDWLIEDGAQGNWRWRLTDEMLSASAFRSLRDLTLASARTGTTMAAAS
jgi:4-alpha-glucanotransferase